MAPISSPVLPVTTLARLNSAVSGECSGGDGIVPAGRANSLILGVSAAIQQYLRRSLRKEEFVEKLSVFENQARFSLFHSPIEELTEVLNDTTAIDLDTIRFDDYELTFYYRDYPLDYGVNFLTVSGTGGMAESTADFAAKYPDIVMEAENWILVRLGLLAHPEIRSKGLRELHESYYDTQMPASMMAVLAPHRRQLW